MGLSGHQSAAIKNDEGTANRSQSGEEAEKVLNYCGCNQWIPASVQIPTIADGDDFEEIYWCNPKHVRRVTVHVILKEWDWTDPDNLSGYWRRTGVKQPAPPK